MPYDRNDPPSVGGSHEVQHGLKVGEPGGKQTTKMQDTQGTSLPNGGAPRRHGMGGGRHNNGRYGGSKKMGMDY